MTSLLTILIWAAVCGIFFFTKAVIGGLKPSIKAHTGAYTLMILALLVVDNYVLTPCWNIVTVEWAVKNNAEYHAQYRNTVMSYINSPRWNEFGGQRIQSPAVNQLLTDLRGATKESSQEAYNNLVCYMDSIFNRYDYHGRAAVRCFGKTLNGSKADNGTIRMWVSLLVDGTSNLKAEKFQVYVKPSLIEAAIADVESTLSRWEEEGAILDAYNAKQDKLRNQCMGIWNRPMNENSERFSLRWLHEHCNSKYPSAWTVEDIQ